MPIDASPGRDASNADNHYFSIAKPQLKGLPKQYSDIIDLSMAWWDKK